jgi:hypothetical protein
MDAPRLDTFQKRAAGGGLFFDFDNDGWMDIYLVNSGPSDFFTPKVPIRNALYRNNHDGTFTDVTEKSRSRLRDDGLLRNGSSSAPILTVIPGQIYMSPLWAECFVSQQRQRHIH